MHGSREWPNDEHWAVGKAASITRDGIVKQLSPGRGWEPRKVEHMGRDRRVLTLEGATARQLETLTLMYEKRLSFRRLDDLKWFLSHPSEIEDADDSELMIAGD